ncbi:hypothetical protein XI05_07585 [Bradyrhizobium sp. CCBAU 11357]|nr:hypothetical protein [Bradyrhizobium sp. CCBAU 11357]
MVAIPLLAPHVLGRLCLREPRWRLPGIEPRKHRGGINETFDKVRAGFEAAWQRWLATRSEIDYEAWRS